MAKYKIGDMIRWKTEDVTAIIAYVSISNNYYDYIFLTRDGIDDTPHLKRSCSIERLEADVKLDNPIYYNRIWSALNV